MNYCFGVDIGGTTVKLGLFEFNGTIVDKWEIKTYTENEGAAILPDVAKSIASKMEEHQMKKEQILGIGVGVPAPVADGIVNGSANLGWKYKNVKAELEELTGIKVKVGNDANVAALGEMWKGGGQGNKDLIMVTLGTGVGGGIIVDGRILGGFHGAGGEIGHANICHEETAACNCGNSGCLEQYASATGIVRLAKKALAESSEDSVLRNTESIEAKDVLDAFKSGDALAVRVMDEVGEKLGGALGIFAAVVDPDAIVIGGGVSKAGQPLINLIEKHYKKYAFSLCKDTPIVIASLGNDAGIYGAAKMVL